MCVFLIICFTALPFRTPRSVLLHIFEDILSFFSIFGGVFLSLPHILLQSSLLLGVGLLVFFFTLPFLELRHAARPHVRLRSSHIIVCVPCSVPIFFFFSRPLSTHRLPPPLPLIHWTLHPAHIHSDLSCFSCVTTRISPCCLSGFSFSLPSFFLYALSSLFYSIPSTLLLVTHSSLPSFILTFIFSCCLYRSAPFLLSFPYHSTLHPSTCLLSLSTSLICVVYYHLFTSSSTFHATSLVATVGSPFSTLLPSCFPSLPTQSPAVSPRPLPPTCCPLRLPASRAPPLSHLPLPHTLSLFIWYAHSFSLYTFCLHVPSSILLPCFLSQPGSFLAESRTGFLSADVASLVCCSFTLLSILLYAFHFFLSPPRRRTARADFFSFSGSS